MRRTHRPTTPKRTTAVVLLVVAGAISLLLALGSALAAPGVSSADATAPPEPVLDARPDDPTFSRNAHLKVNNAEAGVRFECRLDGAPFGNCGSVANFNNLSVDEHCFDVRAVDDAGNRSPVTGYCWVIVLMGGFPVTGTVPHPFAPGVTRPLNLVIGNPYNFAIRVTSVAITVAAATNRAGCSGPANLQVTEPLAVAVTVPADSTRSLEQLGVAAADWPQLTMPNLATNQDACKNADFSLAFSGQATRP
jgi:hypothetical protein